MSDLVFSVTGLTEPQLRSFMHIRDNIIKSSQRLFEAIASMPDCLEDRNFFVYSSCAGYLSVLRALDRIDEKTSFTLFKWLDFYFKEVYNYDVAAIVKDN